jgi:hypothetical protein
MNSRFGFWLRRLGAKFLVFIRPVRALHRASPRDRTRAKQLARFSAIIAETESRALPFGNGRILQTQKFGPPSCQNPNLELTSVYPKGYPFSCELYRKFD